MRICNTHKKPSATPDSAIDVFVSTIIAFLRVAATFYIKKKHQSQKKILKNTNKNKIVHVAAAPFLFRLPEFPVIKSTPLRQDEE
jgi:hypothetical protein